MTRDLFRFGLVVGCVTLVVFAFGSLSLWLILLWMACFVVYGGWRVDEWIRETDEITRRS